MEEETVIKFDTAKLAKEKGFNIRLNRSYSYKDASLADYNGYYNFNDDESVKSHWRFPLCSAPTQSQLQTWLRKTHNILVNPMTANVGFIDGELVYSFKPSIEVISCVNGKVFKRELKYNMFQDLDAMSYEDAFELGLIESLKLIV